MVSSALEFGEKINLAEEDRSLYLYLTVECMKIFLPYFFHPSSGKNFNYLWNVFHKSKFG
jgi:hypothetical protein